MTCRKDESKQKEVGTGLFFKKITRVFTDSKWVSNVICGPVVTVLAFNLDDPGLNPVFMYNCYK